MRLPLLLLGALTLSGPRPAQAQEAPALNTLTPAEKSEGWKLLFDGRSLKGWRGFQKKKPPAGWAVVDGAITRVDGGGDLITAKQFSDFELSLDWNISEGGNSGIMFRVTEGSEASYETGPEMQVLDDARHADGHNRLTSAGSAYGLYAAPAGIVRPAGEWNHVRLIVRGKHVEQWLNGNKVVEYELQSPEWEAKVAGSKFRQWPGYGRARKGYIALQDHGDRVAYRNIKLRELR